MQSRRFYAISAARDFYPSSKLKIYRNAKNVKKKPAEATSVGHPTVAAQSATKNAAQLQEYYENAVKVQMLSHNLHKQIFPQHKRNNNNASAQAGSYIPELRRHGIDIDSTEPIEDVKLKLPPLRGTNIEEHFYVIAKEQVAPYEQSLIAMVDCAKLPQRPKKWVMQEGWTMYDAATGVGRKIDFPVETGLVLDVETCVSAGSAPVLATAVSTKHWYSWVSPKLLLDTKESANTEKYTLDQLIPLGRSGAKLIVGHNVSFDRARLREEYLMEDTGTRFLDTMSLHVCVSGVTSYQRAMLKSKKEPLSEDLDWISQSSLNSLVEVHRLYCGGESLSKEPRNIFVEGTLDDVRTQFQMLTSYCANDVAATHRVLCALYPLYEERFPHPVTLAGILEMGSSYLPVNTNWSRYIREADLTYKDLSIEAKYHLARRADEACALMHDDEYRKHLWLWSEDWSVQQLKMKQARPKSKTNHEAVGKDKTNLNAEEELLFQKFQYLYDKKDLLPARRPLLPGYPLWYRKLCQKPPKTFDAASDWSPGATELGTGMQIAPKLLSLCWEGYPLHHSREHGWGFLVPFRTNHVSVTSKEATDQRVPIEQLIALCPIPEFMRDSASAAESEIALEALTKDLDKQLGKREYYSKLNKKDYTQGKYKGSGVWCHKIIDDCCIFLKLPHKNGKSFRVGNPLSKDFLNKFSDNVLSSGDAESSTAARVIEIARMMSYWRNNRDRITEQLVVWLNTHELPPELRSRVESAYEFGAICPQVVACGTLTRRAMEPTWMTASNSRPDRIGSELRAMIQAPPNYKFVGADVDSQELWIASVLGDADACKEHGATPLGWMTLSGAKSKGTDMHSITAKAVGISRDHAKVINYARIYGAGQNFAEGLLKQFNPTFSASEAKSKAIKMFTITKGKRVYKLREQYHDECENRAYTSYEAMRMAQQRQKPIAEVFHRPYWHGGTESAMFNRLEAIATSEKPVTPFLECRLSRALESNSGDNEQRFLPTRINWVVQSGAVDFLHLMLVSMRWLMGPHVRFCLSFHDEVRYLVKDEFAYKAALSMHITNLMTRAFCASRIGLNDLPMSVAFFSSVEVDTVLRKECTMDCKTPSNEHGLQIGYGIPPGESLNIYQSIQKAGDAGDLTKWQWIKGVE